MVEYAVALVVVVLVGVVSTYVVKLLRANLSEKNNKRLMELFEQAVVVIEQRHKNMPNEQKKNNAKALVKKLADKAGIKVDDDDLDNGIEFAVGVINQIPKAKKRLESS